MGQQQLLSLRLHRRCRCVMDACSSRRPSQRYFGRASVSSGEWQASGEREAAEAAAVAAAAWSRHASIIESQGNWPFTEQVVRARCSATVRGAVPVALAAQSVVQLFFITVLLLLFSPSASRLKHTVVALSGWHCQSPLDCLFSGTSSESGKQAARLLNGCQFSIGSVGNHLVAVFDTAPKHIHTNTQTQKLRTEKYRRRQVRTKMLLSAICCLLQCSLMGTVCNRPKW